MTKELKRWTIIGWNMKPVSVIAKDIKAMPGQKVPGDKITIRLIADTEDLALKRAKELVKRDEFSCSGLDLMPRELDAGE